MSTVRAALTRFRPRVEQLETRVLLSAGIVQQSSLPVIVVPPGGSIQAAVNAAPGTGAVIDIEPGTYAQTVIVNKPRIQLIGLQGPGGSGVTIQNPGGQANGITVSAAGAGFVLRNVTVQGFQDNGVLLTGVANFVISHVTATADGEYGLFPVLSSHGVIEYCTASGHKDTGIYVGQSSDVTIRQSIAFANVIGIEIENSSNCQALGNESYNNTAGILVDLLPGLHVKVCTDNLVQGNKVHDNNQSNFATPGSIESFVPSGVGILVLGADRTTVQNNLVTRNKFFGIGLASSTLLTTLAGISIGHIEPNPDGTLIQNNIVLVNGTSPSPIPSIPSGADLLWDGAGTDNCWMGNVFITSLWPGSPLPLIGCY